jgi:hypothetical protein
MLCFLMGTSYKQPHRLLGNDYWVGGPLLQLERPPHTYQPLSGDVKVFYRVKKQKEVYMNVQTFHPNHAL